VIEFDTTKAGGRALAIGFLLTLVVLYRDPASGLDAATVGPRAVLYFLVLPVAGVLGGVYASVDGPYSTVPLFFLGSYLGVFGLAVTLGTALSRDVNALLLAVGLATFALAAVAIVTVFLELAAFLGFDPL